MPKITRSVAKNLAINNNRQVQKPLFVVNKQQIRTNCETKMNAALNATMLAN